MPLRQQYNIHFIKATNAGLGSRIGEPDQAKEADPEVANPSRAILTHGWLGQIQFYLPEKL